MCGVPEVGAAAAGGGTDVTDDLGVAADDLRLGDEEPGRDLRDAEVDDKLPGVRGALALEACLRRVAERLVATTGGGRVRWGGVWMPRSLTACVCVRVCACELMCVCGLMCV